MTTSKTYKRSDRGWLLIFLLLFAAVGCASLNLSKSSSQDADDSDSSKTENMPVDPWSLGPDVFAQVLPDTIMDSAIVETQQTTDSDEPATSQDTVVSEPAEETVQQVQLSGDSVFTVQLGTFLDHDKAEELNSRASATLGIDGSVHSDWPFFRLRFGGYKSRISADSLHKVAMSRGFYDARVLKIPAGD